jgi:CRP/FNR family transcriptional regulator, cyclic AMP receptor protein
MTGQGRLVAGQALRSGPGARPRLPSRADSFGRAGAGVCRPVDTTAKNPLTRLAPGHVATQIQRMKTTARAVLRSNLLFRRLAPDTLDRVAAIAVRRRVPRNTTLFAQGDPGDALYAVLTGQVRIVASTADSRVVFLNLMEPGDTFGEIAVIDGGRRTASAVTVVDSELLRIGRADFMALMAGEPALAVHLLQLFCQRLRWTSELLEETALLDLPARIARRILRLAVDHGDPGTGGTALRISQGELANFLSVSRQIVNQHLQDWRKRGHIGLARGRIVIRDPAALARLADTRGAD